MIERLVLTHANDNSSYQSPTKIAHVELKLGHHFGAPLVCRDHNNDRCYELGRQLVASPNHVQLRIGQLVCKQSHVNLWGLENSNSRLHWPLPTLTAGGPQGSTDQDRCAHQDVEPWTGDAGQGLCTQLVRALKPGQVLRLCLDEIRRVLKSTPLSASSLLMIACGTVSACLEGCTSGMELACKCAGCPQA